MDCRWDIISASVDCRTKEERDKSSPKYIPKSRYDSISSYLSEMAKEYPYNDVDLKYDRTICEDLKAKGVKDLMAEHISHLFIR